MERHKAGPSSWQLLQDTIYHQIRTQVALRYHHDRHPDLPGLSQCISWSRLFSPGNNWDSGAWKRVVNQPASVRLAMDLRRKLFPNQWSNRACQNYQMEAEGLDLRDKLGPLLFQALLVLITLARQYHCYNCSDSNSFRAGLSLQRQNPVLFQWRMTICNVLPIFLDKQKKQTNKQTKQNKKKKNKSGTSTQRNILLISLTFLEKSHDFLEKFIPGKSRLHSQNPLQLTSIQCMDD